MRTVGTRIFFLIAILASCKEKETGPLTDLIHLNQVGYYPEQVKIAVVSSASGANEFAVVNLEDSTLVFEGSLSPERRSSFMDPTKIAIFTSIEDPGTYCLFVKGIGYSFPFEIKPHVYRDVAKASIKAFYFQRFSTPLLKEYAGKWARSSGHPDTAVIVHASAADKKRKAGATISSPRGWIDAGDYNKYIVNSGITMGTLLSAYEDFPSFYDTLDLNIPESNNIVPDILDEIVWNLRWMLTMQDANDGGVYHKCTNANFDPFIMPDVATTPRYVVQKGTAATLDFAAVTAQASRIFRKFDREFPGLADSCINASLQAWKWASTNQNIVYDQDKMNKMFDPDISTGGYGDETFWDELSWAACELLVTTRDPKFKKSIAFSPVAADVPSWGQVFLLGTYSLLRDEQAGKLFAADSIDTLKLQITTIADQLIANVDDHPFNTVMGRTANDFIWGSNSVAANQAILLINAYRISGDDKFLLNAHHNLDYLLGRNATHYSFVTGYGDKTPMHPHHRPSEADEIVEPVPGFLVGGPNVGRQDKCAYAYTSADKSYVDDVCSYASNEVAINWNAPLVYLTGAVEYFHSSQLHK
jgi:endoglucanase